MLADAIAKKLEKASKTPDPTNRSARDENVGRWGGGSSEKNE